MADIIESNEKATWEQHLANTNNPHNTQSVNYAVDSGKTLLLKKASTFINNGDQCGIYYYDADFTSGKTAYNYEGWSAPSAAWYQIIHMPLSVTNYYNDLALPVNSNDGIRYRQKRGNAYYGWYTILDTNNFNRQYECDANFKLKIPGRGTSWYSGRDVAPILQTTYTGYNPLLSIKTTNGSWELGPYTNDILYLNYITDDFYGSKTNTAIQYRFDPAHAVGNFSVRNCKAQTSDLTAGSSALTTGHIVYVYE